MFILLLPVLSTLVGIGLCDKNFTVTSEITLEIDVKNYNGQGDDLNGLVVIGIFGDTVPVSSLNFKTLCSGYKKQNTGSKLSFKGTYCHRLVKDMLLHCGDVFNLDGLGTTSIYGETFNDENFIISHSSGGIVSYANRGQDTNGSQFFISFGAARFLDKRHVAFGKVVKGYQYLQAINRMGPTDKSDSVPKRPVKFSDCSVTDVKKYELSAKDMKTDDLEGIVKF